jgi:acyl carrier protein
VADQGLDDIGGAGRMQQQGSEAEARICAMFAQVLEVDRVDPYDDFFYLGGNSLTAIWLIDRLNNSFGELFDIRQLFDSPTPAELATVVTGGAAA